MVTPHSPESRPVFEDLEKSVTLTFGSLKFVTNRDGILHFSDESETESGAVDSRRHLEKSGESIRFNANDYHTLSTEEPSRI